MKKNLLLKVVAVALIAIAFISCKKEIQPTGIKLNQTTLALETGNTANLIATVEPAGAVGSVSWSSSNDGVASIADGVVTAKSAGSATITAKISTFSATCTVTVTDPYVKVTSVTLDKTSLELIEGDAAQLTATVAPDNATDKTVTWKSSDTKVATVSASGEVAAIAEGKATITATAGDVSASCEVAVAKKVIAVESVTLDKTNVELTEGEIAILNATVKPDNATDKTVTWSSDQPGIAAVSTAGVVTAVAPGEAKITAKAGDATAVCTVTVKKKIIAVESITLDKPSLYLTEGETATLTATVLPENATDKTVTWSCDNTAVATVADGVVTAIAEGTAKVTAKAGDATAECTVNVKAEIIKVTGIIISETDFELEVGETKALTVTVTPENATDKTVTWSSDHPGIASVSSDGVVTAVAAGEAKITVKANGGDVSDYVNVTVNSAKPTGYESFLGLWGAGDDWLYFQPYVNSETEEPVENLYNFVYSGFFEGENVGLACGYHHYDDGDLDVAYFVAHTFYKEGNWTYFFAALDTDGYIETGGEEWDEILAWGLLDEDGKLNIISNEYDAVYNGKEYHIVNAALSCFAYLSKAEGAYKEGYYNFTDLKQLDLPAVFTPEEMESTIAAARKAVATKTGLTPVKVRQPLNITKTTPKRSSVKFNKVPAFRR